MVNRRHIRIKVMQSIYAMHQKGSDNLEKEEKFLFFSIDAIQDLYLIMLSSLIEIGKSEADFLEKSSQKHLATPAEQKPNAKFIDNKVLKILSESKAIENALETRRINNWTQNDDYIILLLNEVKKSQLYLDYMDSKIDSFEADKDFIANLFAEVIVPNEKLYDYLEDTRLTWIDDLPLVNTLIAKQLNEISANENYSFKIPKLYKDEEDKDFVKNLFVKTVLNEKEFAKHYAGKTPNWDSERIAEMDTIILKMAICEYIKFPSIPVKVTLNEYLELAKEYSTPKSSIFINGILDIISKELIANKTIQKVGRGLL